MPLHQLEAALVGVTALHLCFLPWALGTMHVWSQLMSLGLSAIGFVLSVLPRNEANGIESVQAGTQKLLRTPGFWLGLLLLAYIAIQGTNTGWRFVTEGDSWWLETIDHLSWLPSGVDAPFDRSNPWRALTIFGALWLVTCSVWVGFQRRKSYLLLFVILISNAALLALLGVLQRLSATQHIFWSYLSSNHLFVSSFIYPNHGGSYFNLLTALSTGLALREYGRAKRDVRQPRHAAFFVTCAGAAGLAVVLSHSRMSISMLVALMSAIGVGSAVSLFRRTNLTKDWKTYFPSGLIVGAFILAGLASMNHDRGWDRFLQFWNDPAAENRYRTLSRQATVDMLGDQWLWGSGAGCFRHIFPLYAQAYPEIYYSRHSGRKYWEHAHNDLLQFPVEFGAVGMVPIAGILGWGAFVLGRRQFWKNPVSVFIVLGCTLTLLHAWVDFVFQNPAVLLTWGTLLVGAIRWLELDSSRRPRLEHESQFIR